MCAARHGPLARSEGRVPGRCVQLARHGPLARSEGRVPGRRRSEG